MLQNLHVKNLALIDETEVEFGSGLNILTGETGAGKSIIIGSINLALGQRVPKEMLKENGEPALVELIFSVDDAKVREKLAELDIEVEDDVTAYLEYPNGATGVFITSTGDAPGTNRFEIDLEKAKLVSENGQLMMFKMEENERDFCFSSKEGFAKPAGEWVTVETPGENTQHNGILTAFASAILNGTDLIAKGQEGINGLTLSNAMHLSSWLDRKITLPAHCRKGHGCFYCMEPLSSTVSFPMDSS